MDDFEELTEEEKRREQERIRRRKLAAREARRRKRRREMYIRCGLVLVVFILLIVGFVKLVGGIAKKAKKRHKPKATTEQQATTEEATTEEPVANIDESIVAKELPANKEEAMAMLAEQGETDPDIKNIHENGAIFVDFVLMNLAVNPEMKDFAMNYAANINIVFDGDFTLDVPVSEVPLYLQYDLRWGYADYGKELLATKGAGPTCLSMVYTYLKQDGSMNPIKVGDYAMTMGYLTEEGSTSWELMTEGAKGLGLNSEELTLSQDALTEALDGGKCIICAVSSGDFTKDKSFIVIKEFKNGFFYVNDPMSQARSDVGWDYKRLSTQITNVWAYTNSSPADGETTDSEGAGGGEPGNANNPDNPDAGGGENNNTDNVE